MISENKVKPKTCKICKEKFTPLRPLQQVCGFDCSILLAQNKRIKSEKVAKNTQKRELKAQKEAIKPRSAWMREAQAAVNSWIRLRDDKLPCVSCGRHHQGQYHAGHYLTVGARPELRFSELNIHKQCSACNNYLSGNLVLYRVELIKRIGLDKVEWLEGCHPPKKYTIPELKLIKAEYSQKIKELKRLI